MGMPRLSVENVMISDHNPILLSCPANLFRQGYSFKFDSGLLQDSAFNVYIQSAWKVKSDKGRGQTIYFFILQGKTDRDQESSEKMAVSKTSEG